MPETLTSFGPFQICGTLVKPSQLSIEDGPAIVRMQPKVMALLVALAQRPYAQVSRDELIDTIWKNDRGSDESLTRLVYQLRNVFKSFPKLAGCLRTISKSGYMLEAEIIADDGFGSASTPEFDRVQDANKEYNFTIAVAGIIDQERRAQNDYLVDGLSRDLTRLLAATPMLSVVPQSSVIALSKANPSLKSLSDTMACRFILTGSFRRQDERILLRFELADMLDGTHCWSAKYNSQLDEFFEVQNDVLLNVSTAISTRIRFPLEPATAPDRPFRNDVYRILQTAETLRHSYGPKAAQDIVALVREGLSIAADDAQLNAALAVQLSQNVVSQWEADPDGARLEARNAIAAALLAEPKNPEVLASAGIVNTMFHRPDEAIRYLQEATSLDPNNAHADAVLGWQICLRQSDAKGIAHIKNAEQCAPHHPRFGLWATYRATSYLFMLDYMSALPACEEAIARTPNYYQPRLSLAWSLIGQGDEEGAAQAVRAAERFEGDAIVAKFVEEMKRWSANSPNAKACEEVLDQLFALQQS